MYSKISSSVLQFSWCMPQKKYYLYGMWIGILLFFGIGAFVMYLLDVQQIEDIPLSLNEEIVAVIDPTLVAVQQTTYIDVLAALVTVSSSVRTEQIDSFLFETRVPVTFQSVHLAFAQSWGAQQHLLDGRGRAQFVFDYYQLVRAL
jgi:hypothetical protein